ncbi:dioxygenase [Nocardioides sp. CFH 31398]|uniref:dioxygenase family protein n=1 Tax=Nocardioides sp. CFH 31398 TaxID=2919579 RepID=UPI001F0636A6|nr:class III extradiol ring-cleavage dioxygenase [Nocardioides sp. CFH 31398]MCH1866166.1 dioxygenase [Nocardioides sp. CFH 31398]
MTAPLAAYESFLRTDAPRTRDQRAWSEDDGALPALFLSHGAPPLYEDAHWISQLFSWSVSLPKPRAVLIVSAHWESAPLALSSSAAATPLVYDFGGFHPRYYRFSYATPDASWLADQVTALLPDREPVHTTGRGLDHGAWVPLSVMYPDADVPVIQMSMPTHDPARLTDIGRRLRSLREQGVLVVGSGYGTHGLPFLTREMFVDNVVPGWSSEFDAWTAEALADADWDRLTRYAEAPGMPYAHPTVEHFTPMFVTLGASSGPSVPTTVIDDYSFGLSKRSFQIA